MSVTTEPATPATDRQYWKSRVDPTWCPGCGDYAVLQSLFGALMRAGFRKEEVCIVSGIGCSSRITYFVDAYGAHTAHGRALPVAIGMALANPRLHVIVAGGDGDGYSIGAGHFPHACRRNPDLLYLVMDNAIYGLTKGQASPTSAPGFCTKTTPYGTPDVPVDPISLAIIAGATFVARAASTHPKDMTDLVVAGLQHRGFALVDVISPCPSFNKEVTFKSVREVVQPLAGGGPVAELGRALELAASRKPLHVGLFWRRERPTLQDQIANLQKSLAVPGETYGLEQVFAKYR